MPFKKNPPKNRKTAKKANNIIQDTAEKYANDRYQNLNCKTVIGNRDCVNERQPDLRTENCQWSPKKGRS